MTVDLFQALKRGVKDRILQAEITPASWSLSQVYTTIVTPPVTVLRSRYCQRAKEGYLEKQQTTLSCSRIHMVKQIESLSSETLLTEVLEGPQIV